MASIAADDFGPERDRTRQPLAHDGPAIQCFQGSLGEPLCARHIRQPVKKILHQTWPYDFHGYGAEALRVFGEIQHAAVVPLRRGGQALKLW